MTQQNLKKIGEAGLLSQILPALKKINTNKFRVQPGDDAAVLKYPKNAVLSIDGLTDGVHFHSSWSRGLSKRYGLSLGQALGWKALGSALSDLAAMGDVQERWALVFLGAPPNTSLSFLKDFQKGLLETAKPHACVLAGGDTIRSSRLTMAVAVGGTLRSKQPLVRTPVRDGDYLCLAGFIGDAVAGLRVLTGKKKGLTRSDERYFVKRFFQPTPLFEAGKILSQNSGTGAMLDVSDSLEESLSLLLKPKKLGVDVNLESIPISKQYQKHFSRGKTLLQGGEDYGLLFSLRPTAIKALRKRLPFYILGQARKNKRGIRYFLKGKPFSVGAGYRHFG